MIARRLEAQVQEEKNSLEVKLMILTREEVESWRKPAFQREVSCTHAFYELVEQINERGFIASALTLGVWGGAFYKVDGNHRIMAFLASDRKEILAPVIIRQYADGGVGFIRMCEDFIEISKHIKTPTADNLLKALEGVERHVKLIRKSCPFIGYAHLWKNSSAPVVNMSRVIRSLIISKQEMPGSGFTGGSAVELAKALTPEETHCLISFMRAAFKAWGRDKEFRPMWNALNLTICLWFFRRMSKGELFCGRGTPISVAHFSQCLLALSLNPRYLTLISQKGRRIHAPETRNPICRELMKTFEQKLDAEGLTDVPLPKPNWPGLE